MVVISTIQLNNISQTIYNLMTGVYNLDYFYSPYNNLIPNDLTSESGAAYTTYDGILDTLSLMNNTLNKVSGSREYHHKLEAIADNILALQRTICIYSLKKGYSDSLVCKCSNSKPHIPIFENYLSHVIRTKDGIGNIYYDQLIENFTVIKKRLSALNTPPDVILKADCILPMLEKRFSILCNKAYSYGQDLAYDRLPIWSNPELSYVNYCRSAQIPTISYEQIIKLYYNASDDWTTDCPAFQCCQTELINFQNCKNKLIDKLPLELRDEFNNICYCHTLIETSDLQNVFVQGFQIGLKLAVEALHDPYHYK